MTPSAANSIHADIVAGRLVVHKTVATARVVPLLSGVTEFTYENEPFIACDYTTSNCGVLYDTFGYYVQGPAFDGPHYTGRFTPRPEQRVTVDLMTQNKRFYCFNGLGSGKSASAIWAAEYLRSIGLVKRVLIVSTLSTLKMVWDAELKNICPHRSRIIVRGSGTERNKRVQAWYDYTIINHDGVKSTFEALKATGYDLIILDEASVYRNDTTDRSRKTRELCEGKRVIAMTATPRPRSSMDAWGLGKLVNPKKLPKSKIAFQNATQIQVSDYTWVDRPDALQTVLNVLQPAIRIRTEDCVSLPETVYIEREVPMSKEQDKARKKVIDDFVYELRNDPSQQFNVINASDVRNKILQVSEGVVKYGPGDNDYDDLDYKPSLDETIDLIRQVEGKALVFVRYRATVHRLADDLRREFGRDAVAISVGGQSGRDAELERFTDDPGCRIIVATPGTMAHGLNLTQANLTVWFGVTSNAEVFEQANARMRRPGQKRTMIVAMLVRCPEDEKAVAVCQGRVDDQKVLLDMVHEYTSGRY